MTLRHESFLHLSSGNNEHFFASETEAHGKRGGLPPVRFVLSSITSIRRA